MNAKPWLAMTPAEREEVVRHELELGHVPSTIAWKYRARPAAVAAVATAIREASGDTASDDTEIVAPTSAPWAVLSSEERDSAVLSLRGQGLSSSQIAAKLDTTRNAVIGYMKRLADAGVDVPGLKRPQRLRTTPRPTTAPALAAKPKPAPFQKPPPRDKVFRKSAGGGIEAIPMRGPNNPHQYDFKGRAEQRAASPGLAPALMAGEPIRPVDDRAPPASKRLALTELSSLTCRWPTGDPRQNDFGFCGHAVTDAVYCAYHTRIAYLPPTVRHRAEIRSAERKFA